MIIREIRLKDSKCFLEMLKKLDSETKFMLFESGERKTCEDEMKKIINKKIELGSLTLIVEDKDKIVGFLSAEKGFANRIKHSAYIVVGILKDYCGKGIGTKLFKHMEIWAQKNKITRLELTVMAHNEGALKLYKKMGFKIEGVKKKSIIVDGRYIDEYYMARLF
ncbi:GNAT family N-acetyltransferase [Tepidibacter formicigenes]|jgi:RimJ/RimL family protein N-acetyltransferase|uniref:Protein N-acetyltransferase, RimJ/RimL family n=1 Tax=Tepidibacter formicigenes DSM 15518 TaxID=1123349 RepID=A0A1M6JZM6_9FIRM|nr:GNAT family N-acetyltransferase [Tepidibacter formicigenes]SHJ52098.1 Protein N-acetyltransferase, RimJ/RimL family [Tepidibacter formicigenes DSM 15518]